MYPITSIHPLLCKAGLIFAKILLDFEQKSYIYHLLILPIHHPNNNILPISLRKGHKNLQPKEQPDNILILTKIAKLKEFAHLLAQKVASDNTKNLTDRVKPIENTKPINRFSGTNIIEEKKIAI